MSLRNILFSALVPCSTEFSVNFVRDYADSSSVDTASVGRKGCDGSCQNRLREDPCISHTGD
jgi:hypothetical protein